jgi:transposase
MVNTRKKYTREFMDSAVRMVMDGDKSAAEVARELGIPDWKVSSWVRAARRDGSASSGTASSNAEELKRLQREHKRLLEEHEILKKAAAFFAQHQK